MNVSKIAENGLLYTQTDKILRYHEDLIHKRKKSNQEINSNLLCVEGVSKNISDIKVQLPDRRERIQQEINRIYQGKHAAQRYGSR
ncbi:unnamed protein product [Sphagnum balticum]